MPRKLLRNRTRESLTPLYSAISIVAKLLIALRVGFLICGLFNNRLRVSVRKENIEMPVIIIIQEKRTEAHKCIGGFPQAGSGGLVSKSAILVVSVEGRRLSNQPEEIIQKFNITSRQTILYFERLESGAPVKFSYRLRAKFPIRAKTRLSGYTNTTILRLRASLNR